MKYFEIVEAGDFKTYSKKFLEYFIKNQNNFEFRTSAWIPLKQEKLEEVLTLIPELKEGTSKFGEIKQIIVIIYNQGENGSVHIDSGKGMSEGVQARLQIPILNTKNSRTAWFEMNERQYKRGSTFESGVRTWPDFYREFLKPVAEVEIIEPTIIRINTPHTIYCDNKEFPRITISISFMEDVVKYLDEV
jgi:hypothetical protein